MLNTKKKSTKILLSFLTEIRFAMKKIILALIIVSWGFSSYQIHAATPQETQLLITHPTAYNLEVLRTLNEKGLIDLSKIELTGIYHVDEKYDYQESKDYLKEHPFATIELITIDAPIQPGELYQKNKLSNIYKELFETSDGIIFFGGPDIPPESYGEETHLTTAISDPYRHYFELSFLFHLLGGNQNESFTPLMEKKPNYLIYGFCLGMQSMNVATGGKLIQDIPSELYQIQTIESILDLPTESMHRNYWRNIRDDNLLFSGNFHPVQINSGELLCLTGDHKDTSWVYSNHHQAVEKIGKGFIPIAYSMDQKIIEGLRHTKYPNVLGVQFHPEGAYLYNEKTYKEYPYSEKTTGLQLLIERKSLEFHQQYWSCFMEKLTSIKNK